MKTFTLYYVVVDASGWYDYKDIRETTWKADYAINAVVAFQKANPNCYVIEAC